MTFDDFCRDLVAPTVKAFELRHGKSSAELIQQYDERLAPHRMVMADIREAALKEGTGI